MEAVRDLQKNESLPSALASLVQESNFSSVAKNSAPPRLNIDAENVKNGLGQLVLTLIKLLHELLEKQALRRIEAESLSDDQIEQLGLTLMQQAEEIERLRRAFNLETEDLNLDLGPLGKLL